MYKSQKTKATATDLVYKLFSAFIIIYLPFLPPIVA